MATTLKPTHFKNQHKRSAESAGLQNVSTTKKSKVNSELSHNTNDTDTHKRRTPSTSNSQEIAPISPPLNYLCHKCLNKGHWINECPLNNTNNNNNNIPPLHYSCHRCGLPRHWINDCPTNNQQNIINKPQWHPQYMNIALNGDLIKVCTNGGVIKSNETEDDFIIFYFNHCDKTFMNQCNNKQLPLFIKFKIGFPKQRINNLLLAFDVEFDLKYDENKHKMDTKMCGEIMKIPNQNDNRNGWIYCDNDNNMYRFHSDLKTHYNIANIVYFIPFLKNGNDNDIQNWAKNVLMTQKYDESIWRSLYDEESKCIHDNIHKLFIAECEIDLREDLYTEFKQFYHLNGRCNVIKICEIMLKYLNAFVNTDGGCIYFGINDKGMIKGIGNVDNEVIDHINVYIDNRLKQWQPKCEWNKLKKEVKIEYIDVIERKQDDYCYKLPYLKVVKATVNAMKLENDMVFRDHKYQSWTRNMASVSKISMNNASISSIHINN